MWNIMESKDVVKFLRRHRSYEGIYRVARSYLAQNPFLGKPLRGRCKGLFRLRVGSLRIIYEIYPRRRTVYVLAVGLRENIYEKYCGK